MDTILERLVSPLGLASVGLVVALVYVIYRWVLILGCNFRPNTGLSLFRSNFIAPFRELNRHGVRGPTPTPFWGNYLALRKKVVQLVGWVAEWTQVLLCTKVLNSTSYIFIPLPPPLSPLLFFNPGDPLFPWWTVQTVWTHIWVGGRTLQWYQYQCFLLIAMSYACVQVLYWSAG